MSQPRETECKVLSYFSGWLLIFGLLATPAMVHSQADSGTTGEQVEDRFGLWLELLSNRELDALKSTLRDNPRDLDMVSQYGLGLIHVAAEHGDQEVLTLLVELGAALDLQAGENYDNNTALHFAIGEGYRETVARLLEAGARTDIENSAGLIPLAYAQRQEAQLAEALLNGQVSTAELFSLEAFSQSLYEGDASWEQALTKHEQLVVRAAHYYDWPHLAIVQRRLDVLETLIELGAPLTYQSTSQGTVGLTPLQVAVRENHAQALALLLQNGVDVNTQDVDGNTALHMTAQHGHVELAELLDEQGADRGAVNDRWEYPYELAVREGQLEWLLAIYPIETYRADIYLPIFSDLVAVETSSETPTQGLLSPEELKERIQLTQDELNWLLFDAVEREDTRVVQRLVGLGANPRSQRDGVKPVEVAISNGFEESTIYLLPLSEATDAELDHLLHIASAASTPELLQVLIDAGADANATVGNGSPLRQAFLGENLPALELLLDAGADPRAASINPEEEGARYVNLFHYALVTGQKALLERVVAGGLEPGAAENAAVLFDLIGENQFEQYRKTRQRYPDIPLADPRGTTVWHALAYARHDIRELKGLFADEDTQADGFNRHFQALLFSEPVDMDSVDGDGYSALAAAVEYDDQELVAAFLEKGAAPGVIAGVEFRTPLALALNSDNAQLTSMLLAAGARWSEVILETGSALTTIIGMGQETLLDEALASEDINASDRHGKTWLTAAIDAASVDLMNNVLGRGAKVGLVDGLGRSPLDLALESGNSRLATTVLDAMATDHVDSRGNTALHHAVRMENRKLFNRALDGGTDINAVNADGETALHIASRQGLTGMAAELLGVGADPAIRSANQLLPLHLAFLNGHREVLELLGQTLEQPELGVPSDRLFDDPRVVYWANLALTGNREAVLSSVEQDLLSENPHPFGPHIWTEAHFNKDLAAIYEQASPALKEALGMTPIVATEAARGNWLALFDRYPPSGTYQERDAWALGRLDTLAWKVDMPKLERDYAIAALKLSPQSFQRVWTLSGSDLHDNANRSAIDRVLDDEALKGTLAREVLLQFQRWQGSWYSDDHLFLDKWLARYPLDVRAYQKAASGAGALGRVETAWLNAARAVVFYPWYSHWGVLVGHTVNQYGEAQAQEVAELMTGIFVSPDDSDEWASDWLYRFASGLEKAGELGRAWSVLGEASEQQRESAAVLRTSAQLAARVERHAEAAEWAKQLLEVESRQNRPLQSSDLKRLVSALHKDSRSQEALEAFAAYRGQVEVIAPGLYELVHEVALDARLAGLADETLAEALTRYPKSASLEFLRLDRLREAGDVKEAIAGLERLIVEMDDDKAATLVDWLYEHRGAAEAEAWLDEALERYPYLYSLRYRRIENLRDGEDKADVAIALQKEYHRSLTLLNKALEEFADERDWRGGMELIDEFQMLFQQSRFRPGLSSELHFTRMWFTGLWTDVERVPADQLRAVLDQVGDCRDIRGLSLRRCWNRQKDLWFALGEQEEAAAMARLEAGIDPDSYNVQWNLVARYSSELGPSVGHLYGYERLQRNPFDPDRYRNFCSFHTRWGGSAVSCLWAVEMGKQYGVDWDYQAWERRAFGNLGDTVSDFRGYQNGSFPGASQRYLNWFDISREGALSGERKQISYRFEAGVAEIEIIDAEGNIFVRQDHIALGKPLYFRKGSRYVRFEYTPTGEFAGVETSGGQWVRLVHDNRGKIQRMNSSQGNEMTFEYNRHGKPSRIEVVGLGAIRIQYDESGEMSRVESADGTRMALTVTQEFQNLLELAKLGGRIQNDPDLLNSSELLPEQSQDAIGELEYLERAILEARSTRQRAEALLGAVDSIVPRIGEYPDATDSVERYVRELFQTAQMSEGDPAFLRPAAAGIHRLSEMYQAVKPYGLSKHEYDQWTEYFNWLAQAAADSAFEGADGLLARVRENDIALFQQQRWLHRTDFVNTGYWFFSPLSELWPEASIEHTSVLYRSNGDLVVGSNQGLAVRRQGYWRWYGFDSKTGYWSQNVPSTDLTQHSLILSLAETGDGALWIGTPLGLMQLSGDYDEDVVRFQTASQGFDSPHIHSLQVAGDTLWVGTADGLRYGNAENGFTAVAGQLATGSVKQVEVIPGPGGSQVLATGPEGVYRWDGESTTLVLEAQVQDLAYSAETDTLFLLENGAVLEVSNPLESPSLPKLIAGRHNLSMTQVINGLHLITVDSQERLAVMTDAGINIRRDSFFEQMTLPFENRRGGLVEGPSAVGESQNGGLAFLAQSGVYRYEPDIVRHSDITVKDLLYVEQHAATYLATGSDLMMVLDGEDELLHLSSVSATHLAVDRDGQLITNDGKTIVRLNTQTGEVTELFDAWPSEQYDDWHSSHELRSILVASDGVIWVTSGAELYRYSDGNATEFNFALDAERFPSRSDMIGQVYETVKGEIRVVASNESHRDYQGVKLVGGLLQYANDRFVVLEDRPAAWFVTGYTPIDDQTAIVSTNWDFARDRQGVVRSFRNLGDPTYEAMKEKSRMLWLGRSGAGYPQKNTWLFPSAGGITVYHDGQWFYPDRLNQLLPEDQAYGQYGGRTVQAVSVDSNGRVFAATDLGLMIYQSQGVASLLTDHDRSELVFQDEAIQHQQAMRDIFIDRLDPDSGAGRLILEYREVSGEIAELELDSVELILAGPGPETASAEGERGAERRDSRAASNERLKQRLAERERYRQKLLAQIERQHLGIYQMLKMDPREIAAVHHRLTQEEALLQFLPTPAKLIIQLVTSDGAQIREVEVGMDRLESEIQVTLALLRDGVQHLDHFSSNRLPVMTRGTLAEDFSLVSPKAQGTLAEDFSLVSPKAQYRELIRRLSGLYEVLLRPFEREIASRNVTYLNASGVLNYLPFGALVRQSDGQVNYAVEHFNLGQMPSLFHFNLVKEQGESFGDGGLYIADPDGSLPGARAEVDAIATGHPGDHLLFGEDATEAGLVDLVMGKKYLHLATHGVLNPDEPEESYLLLAGNQRLSAIDIAMLDLEDIDLAVLSACKSGIGVNGMEYATLARAFALSRVPSVIASYWNVDDNATKDLMVALYEQLPGVSNKFVALANAQRGLIQEGRARAHPSAWAAFSIFGRP